MEKIILNETEFNTINDFCIKIQEKQNKIGSRDNRRGDTNDKRFYNNLIGKIGEYAATKITGGYIDFSIWGTGARGKEQFEPDITDTIEKPLFQKFKGNNIHIKTCSGSYQYIKKNENGDFIPTDDVSWVIDKNDPLYTTPLDNDVIILMLASYRLNEAKAYYLGYVHSIDVKSLWKDCKLSFLNHKQALYWKDLKNTKYLKV